MRVSLGTFSAAILLGLASAAVPAAVEHPALVDPGATDCRSCHADLIERGPFVHPPAAEDCSACHEARVQAGSTSITLIEADPDLCLMCHSELTRAASLDLAAPHSPLSGSCLGCHDPHAAAAEHLLPGSPSELCGSCHDLDELEPAHGGQLSTGGDCGDCHDAHGSDSEAMLKGRHVHSPFAEGSCDACHRAPFAGRNRLRARGNILCEACHGEVVSRKGSMSEHGALAAERGRPGCLNCHDPHLSENPSLLLAVGPAICRDCHGEVVAGAQAPSGHEPAAEDCLECHLHHSAAEEHLLREAPNALCGTCHDPSDSSLRVSHLGADPNGLDCTQCHSPHGTGSPHLLAGVVHAPLLDGCELCHQGSAESLIDGGGAALCAQCHDDIAESADASAHPHAALELADCSQCHNPHAAAQASLVRFPDGEICLGCHEDQAPAEDEVAHGVIGILGCQACHEPHGGQRENLLRVAGSELCLSCHDPRGLWREEGGVPTRVLDRFELSASVVRSMATLQLSPDGQHDHPVKGHRVLGLVTEAESKRTDTDFRGAFTCLTCHDPHKGRSELLLKWNARTAFEACTHCHEK